MARLDGVAVEELRSQLDDVRTKDSVQVLMTAIAHKQGVDIPTLSEWYGLSPDVIESGFDELESRPLPQAIDVIERYAQESPAPFVPPTEADVTYLDYEVLDDYGWALSDDDLFEKAAAEDLDDLTHGTIHVRAGETVLDAAERQGYEWPFACRGGACANCVAIVKRGEIAMPGDHILSDEMVGDMNARLTCVGVPVTEDVKLVYNAKQVEPLDELVLPPRQFEPGQRE